MNFKQNDNSIAWQTALWIITMFGASMTLSSVFYNLVNMFLFKQRKSKLRGKVVVITGASSGLGEALAHVFYSCGCKLILISRRQQELQRVKNALLDKHNPIASYVPVIVPLDLTEINSLTTEALKIVKIYGKVDILINNAGISYRGEIIDTQVDVDIKIMVINYFAQIALTKAILPSMTRRKSGHLVFISSVQGKIAIPYRSAYTASKHALQAWCDSARAELHPKNIKISVVSPGYIKTSLSVNALTGNGSTYGILDKTNEEGYSPPYVAEKILKAILRGDKDILIATLTQRIGIVLRYWLPLAYFWIMNNRAIKQKRKTK